jgi:hypothetical protein
MQEILKPSRIIWKSVFQKWIKMVEKILDIDGSQLL